MRSRDGVLLVFMLPLLAVAQPSVAGPELGYFFDSTAKKILTVSGVPGAALLDDALGLPQDLEKAAIAPHRRFTIAEDGRSETLLLVKWGWGPATVEPFGAPAQAQRIVFSPSGATAAIYYADTRRIQIWTSLPQNPALAREVDSDGELSALAVSDDGGAVVLGTTESLVFVEGDERRILAAGGLYSDAAFRRGSRDFAVAERSIDQVLIFRDGQLAVLREADGIAGPVGVAFSVDNAKLAVANTRTGSIALFDLESGASEVVACDCQPEGLFRFQGNAVFRLTDSRKTAMPLFDGDAAQPRVVAIVGGEQ